MKIKDTGRDGEWFVKQAEKERLERLKRLKLEKHLFRTRNWRPSNSEKWTVDS